MSVLNLLKVLPLSGYKLFRLIVIQLNSQCTLLVDASRLIKIRTHPRATQQDHVKCRHHITIPGVPTQKAISEVGEYQKNGLVALLLNHPSI